MLSATLFHRRISDLIRRVVSEQAEAVPWSPVLRWVARQENIGTASTEGLELEARWRLDNSSAARRRSSCGRAWRCTARA